MNNKRISDDSQCDRIHYAVYNYKWYTLDPRNARGLILLMIRSSKPIYLTAGKVFPMTMATFCNVSDQKYINHNFF